MTRGSPYHILRVGMAITFLWVGVLIFKEPEFWGGFLEPWAAGLLPIPLREAIIGTAVLDIVTGFFLLIDIGVWLAALVGAIHLAVVLTTAGITAITVRDIGLLTATIALFWQDLPEKIRAKFRGGVK